MRSVMAHADDVAPRMRERGRSGACRRGDGRLVVRTADVERLADIFGARLLKVVRDAAAPRSRSRRRRAWFGGG